MQCYLGKINIWISILLGIATTLAEGIMLYFTKNTYAGVLWKFKHVDIQLTQQPMWGVLWYSIFSNMMLLTYRIFNTTSSFDLSWKNFGWIIFISIMSVFVPIYFNYDHNLITIIFILLCILTSFIFYKMDLITTILAAIIIFPIMEHVYLTTSNVYVPTKTPGEIFIGKEPLYWIPYYILFLVILVFLYYFLAKKLPVALIGK